MNKASRTGDASAYGYASTGVHIGDVNLVTGTPVTTRYREQVKRIAPPILRGRDAELAELAEFCTSPATAGTYRWWRAEAWAGKSALMSWFVLEPPPAVRIVSFFITARLPCQDDRGAFIENVLEQLLAMLDQTMPAHLTESTREAHLLGLLNDAAEACHDRGEHLILLVDGLDEDRRAPDGRDPHSIAALLPAEPPAGMRVIVASRPNPPIPDDVPSHHPLFNDTIIRPLEPSEQAQVNRREMKSDLKRLFHGTIAEQELLGLVTAAGGGLSIVDLAALTGCSEYEIDDCLLTVTGRSFAVRASYFESDWPDVFLLGHEELQATALKMFGPDRLTGFRDRLHAWAAGYRARGWPDDTPEYLLRGYFRMLVEAADVDRVVACATDPARQNRMLDVSGGDAGSLSEIRMGLDTVAGQDAPDLLAMLRLAIHRDHLAHRNHRIPTEIPSVWVKLGQVRRAKSLAKSMPGEQRRKAFLSMAKVLVVGGELRQARNVLEPAEALARSIIHPDFRFVALAETAKELAAAGEVRWAESVACSITDPEVQARALAGVAKGLVTHGDSRQARELLKQAEALVRSIAHLDLQDQGLTRVVEALAVVGEVRWAESVACSITDPGVQARALATVAKVLVAGGDLQRARDVLEQAQIRVGSIARRVDQVHVLVEVAEAVAAGGDLQRARDVLEQAEALACSIIDLEEQAMVLAWVAEVLVVVGEVRWAESVARSITTPVNRDRALAGVAEALAAGEEWRRAEPVACSIIDPEDQADVLVDVAAGLAAGGEVGRAESVARSITSPVNQTLALVRVAEALVAGGGLQRARGLLELAESVARSITDPTFQAQELAGVAKTLAVNVGLDRVRVVLEQAEGLARSITSPVNQALALVRVAEALVAGGGLDRARVVLEQAEALARSVGQPEKQVDVLVEVAEALVAGGDLDRARVVLEQAEGLARSITSPVNQALALVRVAEALVAGRDPDRARVVLEQTEALARSITNSWGRAHALASVVKALAVAGEARWAESVAHSIIHSVERCPALASVAEALAVAGEARWAESVAHSITDPMSKARAFARVARELSAGGDLDRASDVLKQAEALALSITYPDSQDQVLACVVDALAIAGEVVGAESVARSITAPGVKSHALLRVAEVLAADGNLWPAARMVTDPLRATRWHYSVRALVKIVPGVAEVISTELNALSEAECD